MSSITIHNHFNIKIGEEIMANLEDLLAKITTIAAAGNIAEVEAEIAELKASVAANTATIAENAVGDSASNAAIADNLKVLEALINQLATAPAPAPIP